MSALGVPMVNSPVLFDSAVATNVPGKSWVLSLRGSLAAFNVGDSTVAPPEEPVSPRDSSSNSLTCSISSGLNPRFWSSLFDIGVPCESWFEEGSGSARGCVGASNGCCISLVSNFPFSRALLSIVVMNVPGEFWIASPEEESTWVCYSKASSSSIFSLVNPSPWNSPSMVYSYLYECLYCSFAKPLALQKLGHSGIVLNC